MSRPPQARMLEAHPSGTWQIVAKPYGGNPVNVSLVRGAPTAVGDVRSTDPFGPASASLTFPSITVLDAIGVGELYWLAPETDVDINWCAPDGTVLESWEGYFASYEYGEDSPGSALNVSCIGAMRQLDDYLAKPEYLYQPLPYEVAIARQFAGRPSLHLAPMAGITQDVLRYVTAFAVVNPGGTAPHPRGASVAAVSSSERTVWCTLVGHNYAAGDQLYIGGQAGANAGTYAVRDVVDDDTFIIANPKGVSATGSFPVRRILPSIFPSWWDVTFDSSKYAASQPWLMPQGVMNGAKWSGMVTRETGKFEVVLTSYVQSLLANMHTPQGQFTLMLDRGRRPVMRHRDLLTTPNDDTLVVELLWPGVKINPTRDFTQRIGVVYGSGTASNGDVYTGMEVTADGKHTYYEPFAARRQVHPEYDNEWRDPGRHRKETLLTFSDGLTELEARKAAEAHLNRFADPGVTATLTLDTDPLVLDAPFARQRIKAGMNIVVRGLFGRPEGMLFHITEAGINGAATVSLTLDSLFRDHLTVDQVRKRGHDALVPYRMLSTMGLYDPKIPDLLFPWSYSAGSGVIPYAGAELFTKFGPAAVGSTSTNDPWSVALPTSGGGATVRFPWTEYTTAYPPSKHPHYYIKIPPANATNADYNWANSKGQDNRKAFVPYPVRLSAAGEIRLLQVCAYDANGHPKAVPFHLSLYKESGISYSSMPMIPTGATKLVAKAALINLTSGDATVRISNLGKNHGLIAGELFTITKCAITEVLGAWTVGTVSSTGVTFEMGSAATRTIGGHASVWDPYSKLGGPYDAGQHYPFFPQAWEKILPDGRTPDAGLAAQVSAAGSIIAGWGTYYEKAGYWPSSSLVPDTPPTGMLVDETPFSYDFRNLTAGVSIYDTQAVNMKVPSRVQAYVMIYCDADAVASTYFLGRMFKKELQS